MRGSRGQSQRTDQLVSCWLVRKIKNYFHQDERQGSERTKLNRLESKVEIPNLCVHWNVESAAITKT